MDRPAPQPRVGAHAQHAHTQRTEGGQEMIIVLAARAPDVKITFVKGGRLVAWICVAGLWGGARSRRSRWLPSLAFMPQRSMAADSPPLPLPCFGCTHCAREPVPPPQDHFFPSPVKSQLTGSPSTRLIATNTDDGRAGSPPRLLILADFSHASVQNKPDTALNAGFEMPTHPLWSSCLREG